MSARRKLTAVDDPLGVVSPPAEPAGRAAAPSRRPADTAALYVRLPTAESDLLARAAFELRIYKRDIISALIAEHVDPQSETGLARLRATVESHIRQDR